MHATHTKLTRRSLIAFALAAVVLFSAGPLLLAQEGQPTRRAQFKPRDVGAPQTRVGGGTRTRGNGAVSILIPTITAETAQASPALLYYVSNPDNHALILTLVDDQTKKTVKKTKLEATTDGIHRWDLAKEGVELEPGKDYLWSAALVVNPNQRADDIIGKGRVRRIEKPHGLDAALASAPEGERYRAYAEQGLWVEMLAALQEQIEKDPNNEEPKQAMIALLDEQALDKVVVYLGGTPTKTEEPKPQ